MYFFVGVVLFECPVENGLVFARYGVQLFAFLIVCQQMRAFLVADCLDVVLIVLCGFLNDSFVCGKSKSVIGLNFVDVVSCCVNVKGEGVVVMKVLVVGIFAMDVVGLMCSSV